MGLFKGKNDFYRGCLDNDMVMDAQVFQKLLGNKLSIGVNEVVFIATHEQFPLLTKGLKLELTMTVILPSNHSDLCLYIKRTFNVLGRGAKTNGERITSNFWKWLMSHNCIYDYMNMELPQFSEANIPNTMLMDVQRDDLFKGIYITFEHIKLNEDVIEVGFNEFRESTSEKTYVCISKYLNDKFRTYMVYNNALYLKNCKDYCDHYRHYYVYYNKYKGTDGHVIISNIGTWVKVKDLSNIEPAEIQLGVEGKDKYEEKSMSALLFQDEILFKVMDNHNLHIGTDTLYTLASPEGYLSMYRYNDDISLKISSINGEVVFNTDIQPKNDYENSYDTNYLKCGNYIKSTIRLDGKMKTMILAPLDIHALSIYNKCESKEISLYLFQDSLYGIVGEYEKVGICIDNRYLYISEIPSHEHTEFLYSKKELMDKFKDVPKERIPHRFKFTPYDKRFTDYTFNIIKGDSVLITKEPEQDSQIKGLKAVVEKVSDNKQFLILKFFNHFISKISIDCITKI